MPVCPFVKFLVWMKWLEVNPAFAILDNQWSGKVIYHFTTTKNRINQLQSTPRNMVANASARMAFDYHKPSNIFSKQVHDSNHWKLLIFQMPSQLGPPFKNSKTNGNSIFEKKHPPKSPTTKQLTIGWTFPGLETGFHLFFVISTAVFLNPSQQHMSLSWLRSAFFHPQQDQLCVKDMPQGCRIFVKENSHIKYLQIITRPFKKAIHDVF